MGVSSCEMNTILLPDAYTRNTESSCVSSLAGLKADGMLLTAPGNMVCVCSMLTADM